MTSDAPAGATAEFRERYGFRIVETESDIPGTVAPVGRARPEAAS